LILTKRPERIKANLPPDWGEGYKNVWLGVSVGSRQRLVSMGALRSIRAAVRWVSCEPLLEDISADISLDGFGWVVTGGESGPGTEYLWDSAGNWRAEFNTAGRRTMELQWAERLRDKTAAAGLPFLFKQITHLRPGYGVNALGRIWHEFPAPPSGAQSDWATGSNVVPAADLLHEWKPLEGRGPIRILSAESEYDTEQAVKQMVDADIANGRINF
jgi:protein gp37